jgi:hypothetical protein
VRRRIRRWRARNVGALSSAEERSPYKREVAGSNPAAPTVRAELRLSRLGGISLELGDSLAKGISFGLEASDRFEQGGGVALDAELRLDPLEHHELLLDLTSQAVPDAG